MNNHLATNQPEYNEYKAFQQPIVPLPSQATLRFLGHMGRNGGHAWALKAAERYFPEGHLMLRAYRIRCTSNCEVAENQSRSFPSQRANPTSIEARLPFSERTSALKNLISGGRR